MEIAKHFALGGEPVFCNRYGSGHINETYLLIDSVAREYILQKINTNVFKNTEALMQNISAVTKHLRKSATSPREVLTLVPTKQGDDWLNQNGEFWRLYEFVSDSTCFDQASSEIFRESAVAFGRFQRQLADFPAHTLTETIPNFHNTPERYKAFSNAVNQDICGRAANVKQEIEFVLAREDYASTLTKLQQSGDLPLRVTHNDTKLNNVLFDRHTRKALCVIDLDTVMPGLAVNDFGDSIRFGASTATEDEQDLEKVSLSIDLFEAYTDGFLSACGSSLTECEVQNLCNGAKMMTLECGARFLADYLSGDTYFHIKRDGHNLDRCRTQFKLVADMEKNWDKMQKVVEQKAKLFAAN